MAWVISTRLSYNDDVRLTFFAFNQCYGRTIGHCTHDPPYQTIFRTSRTKRRFQVNSYLIQITYPNNRTIRYNTRQLTDFFRTNRHPSHAHFADYGWRMTFCEAKITLFASLQGKKNTTRPIVCLGPLNPWDGFAEIWVNCDLLRNKTNAFCFFLIKKNTIRSMFT